MTHILQLVTYFLGHEKSVLISMVFISQFFGLKDRSEADFPFPGEMCVVHYHSVIIPHVAFIYF